ncbi:hypothetical protein ACP70R_048460 [Stipagrostis hirtigluma subsp. patula]
MREPLDARFLGRSPRLAQANQGFMNQQEAELAQLAEAEMAPLPECVVVPHPTAQADAPPAPHLTAENIEALAIGYHGMHLDDVSKSALL